MACSSVILASSFGYPAKHDHRTTALSRSSTATASGILQQTRFNHRDSLTTKNDSCGSKRQRLCVHFSSRRASGTGEERRLAPLAPAASAAAAAGERGAIGTSALRLRSPSALPSPRSEAVAGPGPNPGLAVAGLGPAPSQARAAGASAGSALSGVQPGTKPPADPPDPSAEPPVSSASAVGARRSPGGRSAMRAAPPPSPAAAPGASQLSFQLQAALGCSRSF